MIDVTCPNLRCRAVYHAEPIHIGKHIKCLKCGSLVPILDTAPDAVIERRSTTPSSPTYRSWPKGFAIRSKKHGRISYSGALVLALALAAILFFYLRQAAVPARQTAATSSVPTDQSVSSQKPAFSLPEVGTARLEDIDEPKKTTRSDGSRGSSRRQVPAPSTDERPAEYQSLPNGARISPDVGLLGGDGHGVLAVENGTTDDARVVLYDTAKDEKILDVYVRAKNPVHISGIPTGTYELKYTTGLDWIENEGFRVNPSYSAFEKEFRYTEQRDGSEIQYHDISVTLHPVVGGNAHTRKISREEFFRGSSHRPLN